MTHSFVQQRVITCSFIAVQPRWLWEYISVLRAWMAKFCWALWSPWDYNVNETKWVDILSVWAKPVRGWSEVGWGPMRNARKSYSFKFKSVPVNMLMSLFLHRYFFSVDSDLRFNHFKLTMCTNVNTVGKLSLDRPTTTAIYMSNSCGLLKLLRISTYVKLKSAHKKQCDGRAP